MPEEKDNMSEAERGSQKFNIGSRPEDIEKFRIGDTEDELERARGPEWKHDVPDIRMQAADQEQELDRELFERLLGRERVSDPYYGTDPSFQRMLKDFEILARSPQLTSPDETDDPDQKEFLEALGDKERRRLKIANIELKILQKEALKRLPEQWEELMGAQLGQLEDVLESHFLRLRNPYPYDSRTQEFWFEGLAKGIKRARDERWAGTPQAGQWLDTLAEDVHWGQSIWEVSVGVATILPEFYDGKRMMQWVRMRMRTDPTASFYEGAFAKKVPGLDPESPSILPERFEGGLREKAVRYQDDNTFWRMAVAEVHQMEYDEKGTI